MSRFIEGPPQYFSPDLDRRMDLYSADTTLSYLKPEVLEMVRNPRPITPDSLLISNASELAKSLNNIWETKRKAGELVAIWGCSEERRGRTPYTIAINSIGTGGDRAVYRELLANPEYPHNGVVIAIHYDGLMQSLQFDPKDWITDCGGLKMYEKFSKGSSTKNTFSHDFVDYILAGIHHQDALVHGVLSAKEIRAKLLREASDAPVGVMLEDHRGLLPDIFVAIWDRQNGFRRMLSTIDIDVLRQGNCRPEDLYREGLQGLPFEVLPPQFQNLLKEREEQQKQAREIYKALGQNIGEVNSIHRARATIITTGIRGPVKTPQIYGIHSENMYPIPNQIFEIHIPMQERQLTESAITTALAQASYPLSEAVNNFDKKDQDFSNMNRVIIETPSMDNSSHVAEQLMSSHVGSEWKHNTNGEVIICAIRDGKIIAADWYR